MSAELPEWLSERTKWAITSPWMTPDDFRAERKALKLRRWELALLLRVSPETIQRWERGKTRIARAAQILVRMMLWDERQKLSVTQPDPAR